jgi:hypothetical protein
MIISLFVVLGGVEVMWVAYVPVFITVSGAFIRKQYLVEWEVKVVSVLIESRLIMSKKSIVASRLIL